MQKPWISSLIDNMHHSTLLAGSQTRTPTLSFSRRGRRARSLRRRHPCMLHHAFNRRYHSLQDNEQQKKPRYIVPLWQALSIPKPNPDEITAGDELVQEFPKLFDIPTTNGPLTDEPMQCTLGIVPSHAETPECNRVDVSNAPLEPDTEIASAPEGDAQAVSSVPAELVPSEGELDMPVPTASTIPSTNPSTVDSPTSTEITSSFDKIRTIEATFIALKENFTLPAELDFLPSTPSTPSASSISTSDSDTESTSATDHLTYSRLNRSVRSYEQALTVLLEQLDGVESLGDADVRKSRKDVVRRIELALEELEREVDGRWRIRVLEPPLVKGKVGDEVESNDFVPGLGLDVNYSEGERQDDTQKQNKSQDRADLISGPMPEIIEKDDSSTLVTTVKDDVSAPILTSPVHGNNLIQETSQDHLETSDVSPVANFPPTADHTIDPIKATDSIPSPVLIASTTNSFPGDAEPGFSISSTSSALESAPIVPSNADAIVCDHECTMLDAVPPESAVEIPTPSLLESSSTTNENTGLITVQGADVESEGFLLTSRGSDESVSEHPIVRDSDEDWIEVDV
ncbi:hypothetical protein C0993_010245 [Termitomyces sp. T159_Od127]|nr:hypothetical protein C0993_010245 [Termitomyces sp. T159_Od127]